jgi:epoxyqueuosine reductase
LTKPLVHLLDDASPLVRGAAIWALAQLDDNQFSAENRDRFKFESDESVLLEWEVSAPTGR